MNSTSLSFVTINQQLMSEMNYFYTKITIFISKKGKISTT